MNTINSLLNYFLEKVLIVLMATIVLDVTWQIVSRFIMGNPSSFTEELAGFLLIWIGLLGGAYAFNKKAHLGIDLITTKLPAQWNTLVGIAVSVIVFLFSLFILCIGGIKLVAITFTLNQISPSLKISMGYIYLALPIAGLLMIYYSILFILHDFHQMKTAPKKPPTGK